MKIQKTLKIEINQKDVEEAIIALIAKEDPTIIVDEIVFTPKRSGKDSIAVKVDAHFGDAVEPVAPAAPIVEETVEVAAPEVVVEEEDEE